MRLNLSARCKNLLNRKKTSSNSLARNKTQISGKPIRGKMKGYMVKNKSNTANNHNRKKKKINKLFMSKIKGSKF